MNTIALTKSDRAKKMGSFVWLIVSKLAQGFAFVIKKINWNKVGFVSWRLVVLAFGIVIAFAKLIGSIIVGFATLIRKNTENEKEIDWSDFLDEDDDLEGRTSLGRLENQARPNFERR